VQQPAASALQQFRVLFLLKLRDELGALRRRVRRLDPVHRRATSRSRATSKGEFACAAQPEVPVAPRTAAAGRPQPSPQADRELKDRRNPSLTLGARKRRILFSTSYRAARHKGADRATVCPRPAHGFARTRRSGGGAALPGVVFALNSAAFLPATGTKAG
jgi:hypothetical protein